MNDKINIKKADGTVVSADLVCHAENVKTGKRYIYYTLNEIVGAGSGSTVKIYVAKEQQNNPALDAPIDDADWNLLKGYMGDALKGNTSPDIKYISTEGLSNPVLSISERAIAMPTSYDYINKQRGIYATSLAAAPSTEAAPAPEAPAPAAEQPVPAPQAETPAAPAPAPEAPAPTPEPVAPVAPTTEPAPAPAAPVPPTPEVTPAPVPEAPAPTPEPVPAPVPPVPEQAPTAPEAPAEKPSGSAPLEPIDIASIESKYEEMKAAIDDLKNKEIEAAKRYNATIELSAMHNEQHANYVQSEQEKETAPVPPVPAAEPALATPTPEATPVAPVPQPAVPTAEPVVPTPTPEPVPAAPAPAVPTAEPVAPAPQTPIAPAPTAAAPQPQQPAPAPEQPHPVTQAELETNWFDMPQQEATTPIAA